MMLDSNSAANVINGPSPVDAQITKLSVQAEPSTKPFLELILNSMEQGLIVWSSDGVCEFVNKRLFDVLELSKFALDVGTKRSDFFELAVERGDLTAEAAEDAEASFQQKEPFRFDRQVPSGRIVATNARPKPGGGFIVSFADVTESRQQQQNFYEAKTLAEEAEKRAQSALQYEQGRKKEARLLSELGEWLQSSKSLSELYSIIQSFMAKLFPGSSGELYIYSNSRDVLDGACSWNGSEIHNHIDSDDCWALRRGRMYKFGEGLVDFKCNHVPTEVIDSESQRYVCLPIIAHGDTVGLLHIRLPQEDTTMGEDRVYSFAVQCAEQISLAVANVKLRDELRDQSIRDSLTGLYNRRYFLDRFRTELYSARKRDAEIGLLSIDADHFKHFNDNHGHDAGDVVLRSISEVFKTEFSEPFIPARIGGEEFSILLPGAGLDQTELAAETLRNQIENLVIPYSGVRLPTVTISIGVASFPECGETPLDILKAADIAMYQSKDNGRNCVSRYQSSGIQNETDASGS